MEKEKYIYCGTAFINQKKVFVYYHKFLKEIEFFERKDGIFVPASKEILKEQNSIFSNIEYLFSILKQRLYYRKVKRSRFTTSFTKDELEELYLAVEENNHLDDIEKIQLNALVSLEKDSPGYIDILKERLSTVRIERQYLEGFDGLYDAENNKVLIDVEIPESRYEYLLRHEFSHLFQFQTTFFAPTIYHWFCEGFTELITREYEPFLQDPEQNEYDFFVIVVKILFELFPDNNFLSDVQLNHYQEIYHLLRTKMTEIEFYGLFVKLSLYFDKELYKELNLSRIIVDVDIILMKLARKEPKEVRYRIKNYIRETLGNHIVYRTNYVVGDKESFLYDKQKKIKVKEYKK